MSAELTLRPTGISLFTLLVMSALLSSSALAQAPPFLLEWGTYGPAGVAVDGGEHVYVSDMSGRIQKFTAAGSLLTQWETGPNFPVDVAMDPAGNVFVANITYVRKYTSDGVLLAEWTDGFGGTNGAWAVAVDAAGDVYVVDNGNERIQKFSSDGTLITRWGTLGSGDGQFAYPTGIAVDATGMVYVVDSNNCRIEKFTGSGDFVAKWGTIGSGPGQFLEPGGVAIDAVGKVYVTDGLRTRVLVFTSTGDFITEWGSQGTGPGEFNGPGRVAADANGNVYVGDAYNDRIQEFGPLPTPTNATSWGRLKRMFR